MTENELVVRYNIPRMIELFFNNAFPIIGTIAAVLLIIWLIRHWK